LQKKNAWQEGREKKLQRAKKNGQPFLGQKNDLGKTGGAKNTNRAGQGIGWENPHSGASQEKRGRGAKQILRNLINSADLVETLRRDLKKAHYGQLKKKSGPEERVQGRSRGRKGWMGVIGFLDGQGGGPKDSKTRLAKKISHGGNGIVSQKQRAPFTESEAQRPYRKKKNRSVFGKKKSTKGKKKEEKSVQRGAQFQKEGGMEERHRKRF